MLHHISVGVRDLKRSSALYDAAIGALGPGRVFENETAIGHGLADGQDKFCLKPRPDAAALAVGFHVAFAGPLKPAVEGLYRRAYVQI